MADEYQEQRELLNQVRPCGKGANGGAGSRQRRNPNKVFTRKLSQQEQQRTDDRVQAIIQQHSTSCSARQLSSIDNLLRGTYDLDIDKLHGASALLNEVSRSRHRDHVINAGATYLRAIVFAYALYDKIVSSDPDTMRIYIHKLSELTKISITPEFSLLRAVVRLAIDYDEHNPESDHRGKWSRDALAIQWLINQGVRPDQVMAYQKMHGGGVNKWSRLGAEPAANAQKKPEVEDVAARMERGDADMRARLGEMEAYIHDEIDDRGDRSGKPELPLDKIQNDLERIGTGSFWQTEMLLYYRREMGIAPVEAMITMVVGDPDSPLGVRLVGTMSLGHVISDEDRLTRGFRLLGSRLRQILTAGSPYSWNEGAWRHHKDESRAKAKNPPKPPR